MRLRGFFVIWWRCYRSCIDPWPQRPINATRAWTILGRGKHFKS